MSGMERTLFRKYSGNVPRYTSYPTAVQFHPGIGPDTYARWLEALAPRKPVSLYFHVPYCHQLCWYCACHTRITHSYGPVSDYLDLLKREMGLVSSHLGFHPEVTHIHWGGGSPNLICGEDFAQFMKIARAHFSIADDAEVAMEADPRSLSRDKIRTYAARGINRVSLGVQDFNPHVQRAINRVQPYAMVKDIVEELRNAGISRINFDLMYGLPCQRVADVVRNVELAAALAPDRLAVFGYAHVPWLKPHQKMIPEGTLAGPDERLEMAEAIAGRLREAGYRRIGLDHFAKDGDPLEKAQRRGTLRRNFQGYTTDRAETLIGFGASAIGKFPAGFVQTVPGIKQYSERIKAGRFATARGVETTAEDRLRWDIIERLMCDLRADLSEICARHKVCDDYFDPELQMLQALETDRLVRVRGTRVEIPEQARPLMRVVCTVFDRYLAAQARRHSQAV